MGRSASMAQERRRNNGLSTSGFRRSMTPTSLLTVALLAAAACLPACRAEEEKKDKKLNVDCGKIQEKHMKEWMKACDDVCSSKCMTQYIDNSVDVIGKHDCSGVSEDEMRRALIQCAANVTPRIMSAAQSLDMNVPVTCNYMGMVGEIKTKLCSKT